ncbi:MAG: two-component system, chemotaxis family, CheB/CheR fusion protein [Thermomicrobiales bacterium]|nr:two-component system, chemotaxis family, CheB/CheR fusion protein [Thermomicrobiales bacterium]
MIAQHLDRSHPNYLAQILARRGSLPVITVEDREALVPGTVYVVPANRHIAVTDLEVRVHADAARRPIPSIDLLPTAAASIFGECLIAVILTGSGTVGAAGARAVKEAGATVVLQDPATAAFPSMPRAPVPPVVDIVAPLPRIGGVLAELLAASQVPNEGAADPDLAALLAQIRARRGSDLPAYKAATIDRRLRARMAAVGVETIPAYLGYLEQNPQEEQRLVGSFLIRVTRFFRDLALFTRL